MDEAELGVSRLIKEDGQGKFTECGDKEQTCKEQLDLGEPPIFARVNRDIVRDGFACYRVRLHGSVGPVGLRCQTEVGDSKRQVKAKMLRLAKERNIPGVLQLFSHESSAVARVSDNTGSTLENTVEAEGRRGTGNKI